MTQAQREPSRIPPEGNNSDKPIAALPGIGDKREEQLANLGIRTIRDLVYHIPRDYADRRELSAIADLVEGATATIEAEVVSARSRHLRRGFALTEASLRDATGSVRAVWFGRAYLARTFKPGSRGLFTGLVDQYRGLVMKNPDYEFLTGDEEDRINTGRIVPIYRLTEGVTQRMLRQWITQALSNGAIELDDALPEPIRLERGFPPVDEAIRNIHFPPDPETAHHARTRFAYEELLAVQVAVLSDRAGAGHDTSGLAHQTDGPLLKRFHQSLPFTLTEGQREAIEAILADMATVRPMMRLLQGDVGCGKTVVALHAIAAAADGGYQTALMAPTEILAEQHGLTLRRLVAPLGLQVEVLTGSTPDAKGVRERIASGETHVVAGTHALIQDAARFHRLGLTIIDEQHRFGVMQRGALRDKGPMPDVLHMTATPIPRTLAITVYGGMDLSIIDELPPGRLPIKTRRISASKVEDLYRYLHHQASAGLQTYYVCPLVEESESRDLTAVTTHFEELSHGPLAGLRTGLLHGRMASRDKEAVMEQFAAGGIDVLFSTTVIEVGIDCPNATTMVIEDAGQFGLTQLHQLRGRVGRGSEQSYCFLLGKPKTREGVERLRILCEKSSGFDIAEEDLRMRGPGEFQGVRQAGLSELRVADLVHDVRLLDGARRDAQQLLLDDPSLTWPANKALARAAARFRVLNA